MVVRRPGRLHIAFEHAQDIAACQDLLRTGSRTFYAASYLLPRRVREPAISLYAFCRIADDMVDLGGDATRALDALRRRLEDAYAGQPHDHPADRAFARVVAEFNVPQAVPLALLDGFAWDAARRQYETLDELNGYGARVAGTVGVMMALLMRNRSAEDLARASDLGMAMQLTNIARDVGEDARAGRLYLPRQWMREAGLSPDAWLANPTFDSAIGDVVRRVLDAADALYLRSEAGIANLPNDCRAGIYAARNLYAGIGHELRRMGCDSVSQRAVVPASRKLSLVARALAASPRRRVSDQSLTEPAAAFLVAAACDEARMSELAMTDSRPEVAWWDLHGQAVVLLEILERLDRRERAAVRNRPTRSENETYSPFNAEVMP